MYNCFKVLKIFTKIMVKKKGAKNKPVKLKIINRGIEEEKT